MTKQQIFEEALKLSDADRRGLAEVLLDSVAVEENAIPPEWQEEFERRIEAAGSAEGMPLEEFIAWLERRPAKGEREAG